MSGSDSSYIVLITSTNGTWRAAALQRSGRMLIVAPINRPPAEPPEIAILSRVVQPEYTNSSAQAAKSVKVFRLNIILPLSCQAMPMSAPPRICPVAQMKPRSRRLNIFELKPKVEDAP